MTPRRILLVEDSNTDVFLVREALREHGINAELSVVEDGQRAKQLLESKIRCPDLIILDLNLPHIDGLSLLRLMREQKWCDCTPVAVLTSSQADRDRKQTLALGARRFLHKATALDEFLAIGRVFKELLYPSSEGEKA